MDPQTEAEIEETDKHNPAVDMNMLPRLSRCVWYPSIIKIMKTGYINCVQMYIADRRRRGRPKYYKYMLRIKFNIHVCLFEYRDLFY